MKEMNMKRKMLEEAEVTDFVTAARNFQAEGRKILAFLKAAKDKCFKSEDTGKTWRLKSWSVPFNKSTPPAFGDMEVELKDVNDKDTLMHKSTRRVSLWSFLEMLEDKHLVPTEDPFRSPPVL